MCASAGPRWRAAASEVGLGVTVEYLSRALACGLEAFSHSLGAGRELIGYALDGCLTVLDGKSCAGWLGSILSRKLSSAYIHPKRYAV